MMSNTKPKAKEEAIVSNITDITALPVIIIRNGSGQ